MSHPVINAVSTCLAHVPGLARYGSKPVRSLDPAESERFQSSLRTFDEAVAYPPHQAFLGNLRPEALDDIPRPWYEASDNGLRVAGPYGVIVSEEAFAGLLKKSDEFGLLTLEGTREADIWSAFDKEVREQLRWDPDHQPDGSRPTHFEEVSDDRSLPLYDRTGRAFGRFHAAHEVDETLQADILLENLAVKASGVLALRHMLNQESAPPADKVDFLLSCGEEAVGDRYQRGGGNIAKAIGEAAGCSNASGADIKAFCCAPVHALVIAASLVQAGTFRNVTVVAGGSLAKLGMKYQGHLKKGMPVLEDVLGAFAISVGPDDGRSPQINLDAVGVHPVSAGGSQEAIINALVVEPLSRLGMKISDIDKYAMEMHNPEITEPSGSGNIPRTNYRTLASVAVLREEIQREQIDEFVREHGMPGFSPTQGHIAAGVPFIPHARSRLLDGEIENMMVVAKGSLFLGRMTNLSDGMSVLLSRNEGSK